MQLAFLSLVGDLPTSTLMMMFHKHTLHSPFSLIGWLVLSLL